MSAYDDATAAGSRACRGTPVQPDAPTSTWVIT